MESLVAKQTDIAVGGLTGAEGVEEVAFRIRKTICSSSVCRVPVEVRGISRPLSPGDLVGVGGRRTHRGMNRDIQE